MLHHSVQLPWWSAIAVIAVLAPIAVLAVWLIPLRQRDSWERLGLTSKEVAELENGARSTVVQLVGGVALILTFVATWVQISDTRQASERATELAEAQQETEHFTRAVEQLGSSKLAARMGGIYALEQIAARDRASAEEEESRRETVAMLMIAFLKNNPKPPESDRRIKEIKRHLARKVTYEFCGAEDAIPPRPDIQVALTVLLDLVPGVDRPRPPALDQLDLADNDHVGVRLNERDLSNANLRLASLAGAKLSGVSLDRAALSGADLRGACLQRARFRGAKAAAIRTAGADFSGADLETARFLRCQYFKNAIATGANPPMRLRGCPWLTSRR